MEESYVEEETQFFPEWKNENVTMSGIYKGIYNMTVHDIGKWCEMEAQVYNLALDETAILKSSVWEYLKVKKTSEKTFYMEYGSFEPLD